MKWKVSIALILFILLTTPVSAAAEILWSFDFEQGPPRQFLIQGAGMTNEPGKVVAGNGSLMADFAASENEWNEFLQTRESVVFEKGILYHVSFDYLVHAVKGSDAEFYVKMRLRGAGPEMDNDGVTGQWLWRSGPGIRSTAHRLFRPEHDGYFLMIGVRNKASWSIDNLVIEKVEPMDYPSFFKLKPGPDHIGPLLERVESYQRAHALRPALDDMLVIFCNEGSGHKGIERTSELMQRFDIDFVDWNRLGPMARRYGVRTSSGGPEYQEYYPQENMDMPKTRVQKLLTDGAQITLNNTAIPQMGGWVEGGGWYVCQNSPNWHEWFKEKLWEETDNLMAVCQDNISVAPWESFPHGGCFCEPCQLKFQEYLRERYNQNDLGVLGIKDLNHFRILDAIHRYGLVGEEALRNPLTREYIKFQNISQALQWADCVVHIHEQIRPRKRTTAVYGNQINLGNHNVFATLLSPFCDIVQIEEVTAIQDEPDTKAINYKVGRASGYEDRPVWMRGPVIDQTSATEGPMTSSVYWTLHMTEALAAGGVRDFSIGYNRPPAARPADKPDYLDHEDLMEHWERLAAFKRLYRPLFSKRESAAKVAIVYSIPSLVFRQFPPLGVSDGERLNRHRAWAAQLDRWHVPYDVVIFGHPEMFKDDYFLRRLDRYDVLLIPVGDAMTDDQIRALRTYVARGGKVYTAEPAGVKNEDWNRRSDFEKPDLGPDALLSAPRLDSVKEALVAVHGVETDLPESVQMNLWLSQQGKALDIHLVNFDVDIVNSSATRIINAALSLPKMEGVDLSKALLVRPFEPALELDVLQKGDRAEVVIPWMDVYAIVSFTSREQFAHEQELADERRHQDRTRVKYEAEENNLY